MTNCATEDPRLEHMRGAVAARESDDCLNTVDPRAPKYGALYMYVRRNPIPAELSAAARPLGYWRFIPASARRSAEATLIAAGWEIAPERRRLRVISTAFRSMKAHEKAVKKLLRLAVEERVYAIEIVFVRSRAGFLLWSYELVARVVEIRATRTQRTLLHDGKSAA